MKNLFAIFLLMLFCVGARGSADAQNPSPCADMGHGRDAALGHFVLALQLADEGESPDMVAEALIAAINCDRKNATLPATYLLGIADAPEIGTKAYQTLLELSKENPESFFFRYAAIAAGSVSGIDSRELDKLFPTPEKMQTPCRSVNEESYRIKLLFIYAENLLNIPDHAGFKKLTEALSRDMHFIVNIRWHMLICKGLNSEYLRNLAAGKDVESIQQEMNISMALLILLASESEKSVEKTVAVFKYLESLEIITPEFLDLVERILPQEIFRTLQIDYISKFGSAEDIAAAIELPYPGKTPAKDAMLLFYNAIANENLSKAKQVAETFPDKNLRPQIQNMYAIASGNFDFEKFPDSEAAQNKNTLVALLGRCKTPEQVLAVAGAADKSFWNDPDFTNAVGYTLTMTNGDLEQAEKLLNYSLRCKPDKSDYLDSMAMILFKKGKLHDAQKMLARALQTLEDRGSYKTLLDHAGDVELALGNREMALTYYRRALKCFSRIVPNISETEEIHRKIEKLESTDNGK